MRKRKEKWVLPSHRPEGTKVLNDLALRTPFVKSGSDSFLKVEIDDFAIEAIEFLIVDERQNRCNSLRSRWSSLTMSELLRQFISLKGLSSESVPKNTSFFLRKDQSQIREKSKTANSKTIARISRSVDNIGLGA